MKLRNKKLLPLANDGNGSPVIVVAAGVDLDNKRVAQALSK